MYNKKTRFVIACTAVVVVSLLYFFADARAAAIFPRCPFYLLTGLFCPGCGSQRAVSALLHLDLASAARYNVLLVASLPIILYSSYAACVNTFSTKKVVQQRLFHSVWFIRLIAVVVLLFWVLRNLGSYPFHFLAPGA
jgi:hypothetical protein